MRRNFSRCTFVAKTATLAVLLWLLSPILHAQSVDIQPAENWTGNVKGGDHFAQNGTSVWSLEIRDAYTAEQRRYTGHVTLIR